jgi:hypothetical protein
MWVASIDVSTSHLPGLTYLLFAFDDGVSSSDNTASNVRMRRE